MFQSSKVWMYKRPYVAWMGISRCIPRWGVLPLSLSSRSGSIPGGLIGGVFFWFFSSLQIDVTAEPGFCGALNLTLTLLSLCCASKSAALTEQFAAPRVNVLWLISGLQPRRSTHHSAFYSPVLPLCILIPVFGCLRLCMLKHVCNLVHEFCCMCVAPLAFFKVYVHTRIRDVIRSDTNKSKSH